MAGKKRGVWLSLYKNSLFLAFAVLKNGCGVSFALMDRTGKPVSASPEEGFFIRIDLPGPSAGAGRGYDWVQIEKIEKAQELPYATAHTLIRRTKELQGNECAHVCNQCISSCLQEEEVSMLTRCISLDMDCAEICIVAGRKLCSSFCGKYFPLFLYSPP
ncbi:hypothetical protein [Agriterribacter sp.]|uniref:hypothetical protein n=1 Tax=Agriterribacter sp. TaxID=2821509 RepID=UPI002C87DE15|nr:hypothetical protein [Agriterribacter sp.]HRO44370.1 hypothetical protein [Agriterribacter sp.]HRQ16686.1 hypothetical protein [Agriterribacter sp.]